MFGQAVDIDSVVTLKHILDQGNNVRKWFKGMIAGRE